MDADTLATMITILVAVLGSSAVTIGTVLKQTNHLDAKFTRAFEDLSGEVRGNGDRLTRLEEQANGIAHRQDELNEFSKERGRVLGEVRERLTRLEEQANGIAHRQDELNEFSKERGRVLGEVRERLSRMEGYLMAPDGFTLRRTPEPDARDGSADDPGTEHREQREAG